jgi:Holliday junction DNA helicase RuvB
LENYGPDELAAIVRRSAAILDVALDDDGALAIAARSRGTPRVANRLLRRVRDWAEVRGSGIVTADAANSALELLEVDELGCDRLDREILTVLCTTYSGRPVGLSTLSIAVGEEPDTIEEVYEPYLVQCGLISRTARGRTATMMAYEHLGLEPPRDAALF